MFNKIKIEIKTLAGSVLFEYETKDNTLKKTLEKAVLTGAYLRGADLTGADLRGADLRGAYLRDAYLRGADLTGADLRGADLRGAYLRGADLTGADLTGAYLRGADLRGAYLTGAYLTGAYLTGAYLTGAYLRGAKLKDLPEWFINQASRDMLFIFKHLKAELPFLKKKLLAGEINGTCYEGDCACLIGTLANADGGIDQVCSMIPYYDKGTHNPAENWFWNINTGDTPKNNEFAKYALKLVNQVLKEK